MVLQRLRFLTDPVIQQVPVILGYLQDQEILLDQDLLAILNYLCRLLPL